MARQGVRSSWVEVPRAVRADTEELLGARIVATEPMSGGFSPGPAVRAELSDGRTVFCKAAGPPHNAVTAHLHRAEATVLGLLPDEVPAPRLLGRVDDGGWIVLVVQWVEGATPDATDPEDLRRLFALLGRLTEIDGAALPAGIDTLARTHGDLFGHWTMLADQPHPALDAWSRRHLDQLAVLDAHAREATAGDHLLHVDVRTDNVVLAVTVQHDDVLVDWPGAARGAPWVDVVGLLPALHLDGGPPPEEALAAVPWCAAADPEAIDVTVVALAGYFTRSSLLEPPPGLPTLRAFQASQGAIARRWAAERLRLG